MEDTAWDTLVWDTPPWDTEVCTEDTEDTDTDMASVRLRLSPRLMLKLVLIPTTLEDTEDMEDMAWDTLLWDTLVLDTLVSDTEVCMEDTEDTDMDMASVRLRLSPRLMLRLVLIPTTLGIQRIWRIRAGILYSRILSSWILSFRIRRSVRKIRRIQIWIWQA